MIAFLKARKRVPAMSSAAVAMRTVPRTIAREYPYSRNEYIMRDVSPSDTRLLVRTLMKSERRLVILPRFILPLMSETTSQRIARRMKKGVCDGR